MNGSPHGPTQAGQDFAVDLDRLTTLQSRLGEARLDLGSGPAGSSAVRGDMDPRSGLAPSLVRANSDSAAAFAYGLLNESGPLGHAHIDVMRSVLESVDKFEHLIEALRQHAARSAGSYTEADASVLAEIITAGGGA